MVNCPWKGYTVCYFVFTNKRKHVGAARGRGGGRGSRGGAGRGGRGGRGRGRGAH